MKKFLSLALCVLLLLGLSACKSNKSKNKATSSDAAKDTTPSIVRALTATDDLTEIESFEIVHKYSDYPTKITDIGDLEFLSKYFYSNAYEGQLHELYAFPKNQIIYIYVNGYKNTLYLLEDGSIVMQEMNGDSESPDVSYEVYKSEAEYMLTAGRLIALLKKYNGYDKSAPSVDSSSVPDQTDLPSYEETTNNEDTLGVTVVKKYKFNMSDSATFSYENFDDTASGKTMPYRLHLPKNMDSGKKYPVILFLHGAGEIGSDNEEHLPNFTQCFSIAGDLLRDTIIICPQTPAGWSLHDNGMDDQNGYLSIAKRIVDSTVKKYKGDRNRIYVTGLSLGSFATWDIIDAYPNYFAAAVPVCGGGGSFASESFINTPIWIFHGTDDPTVPYESSLYTYQAIVNEGGEKVKFTTLDGVAHNAWDYAYKDRAMFSWLLAQNLKNKKMVDSYKGVLEIVAADGTTVLNEKNIDDLWGSSLGSYEYIELYFDDDADYLLSQKFNANKNQAFTVKFFGKRLYDFKFTSYPKDNNMKIIKTVDDDNYREIIELLENTIKFNQEINGY